MTNAELIAKIEALIGNVGEVSQGEGFGHFPAITREGGWNDAIRKVLALLREDAAQQPSTPPARCQHCAIAMPNVWKFGRCEKSPSGWHEPEQPSTVAGPAREPRDEIKEKQ
jgi:hypothetical protein